jgi:hypothetical protein
VILSSVASLDVSQQTIMDIKEFLTRVKNANLLLVLVVTPKM